MKTNFEFSAGGVVVRGNEVLVIKTRNLKNEVVYTFPKGHIEKGETAEETALREVAEETGVCAEIIKKLRTVKYWFVYKTTRVKKQVIWYLMKVCNRISKTNRGKYFDPFPGIKEIDAVLWLNFDDAIKVLSYESDKDLVKTIRQELTK